MKANDPFFPARPEVHPQIYAYRDLYTEHKGLLKVGFTQHDVEQRVAQQFPIILPGEGKPYEIVFSESAMRADGTSFTDHDVHRRLERNGFQNVGGEWYRCAAADVRNAWLEVRDRTDYGTNRTELFKMRPEQRAAVEKTEAYFRNCEHPGNRNAPKFLWNAKMRFGKTFASYQLAKRMNMKRVLILTFKPAVETAWQEDLETHVDFKGWQFVSRDERSYEECDPVKPIVCFGSFQDFLGVNRETGGIKTRNEWVHLESWDLVIFDEYHFGAWKDSAKSLFKEQNDDAIDDSDDENAASSGNTLDETWLPIQSRFYLYLSGTPFRALNSGEFIEEQVFNWTYSDEQRSKQEWVGADNPYETLPRMVMMTYKVPDSITRIARLGEFDEFDLNVFFSAEGHGAEARFKYEEYVRKVARPHPRILAGNRRRRSEDGRRKTAYALLGRPLAAGTHAYALVSAERRLMRSDGQLAEATPKRILPRLQGYRRSGQCGGHGGRCGQARAAGDGRSADDQNHHVILRQADHGRHHQTMERRADATQPEKPRNVFPNGVSRAKPVDDENGSRQYRNPQAGNATYSISRLTARLRWCRTTAVAFRWTKSAPSAR